MSDRVAYFHVEGNTFPLVSYGSTPEQYQTGSSNRVGRITLEMYIKVATAEDQGLFQWSTEGSYKSGSLEFRNYEYSGSKKTIKFADGYCASYQETVNPDSPMLPRLISLFIIPTKLIYDGDFIVSV